MNVKMTCKQSCYQAMIKLIFSWDQSILQNHYSCWPTWWAKHRQRLGESWYRFLNIIWREFLLTFSLICDVCWTRKLDTEQLKIERMIEKSLLQKLWHKKPWTHFEVLNQTGKNWLFLFFWNWIIFYFSLNLWCSIASLFSLSFIFQEY